MSDQNVLAFRDLYHNMISGRVEGVSLHLGTVVWQTVDEGDHRARRRSKHLLAIGPIVRVGQTKATERSTFFPDNQVEGMALILNDNVIVLKLYIAAP